MKSIRLFLVQLILISLVAVAAQAQQAWKDEASGVRVIPPRDWKQLEPGDPEELVRWETENHETELSLSVSEAEVGEEDTELFLDELMKSFEEDNVEVLEKEILQLGQHKGGLLVVKFTVYGITMIAHNTVILTNQKVHFLIGVTPQEEFEKVKRDLAACSRSLRVE